MIHINTQGGRIGPLWWLNSDLRPIASEYLFNGAIQGCRFICWGTCGPDSIAVAHELAALLRERYGHSTTADWLEAIGSHTPES